MCSNVLTDQYFKKKNVIFCFMITVSFHVLCYSKKNY